MSEKKIITLATLGAALVELLANASDSKLKVALVGYKADFDAFCEDPGDTAQAEIIRLTNVVASDKIAIDGLTKTIEESKGIIRDIKGQLKKAQEVKTAGSAKPTVEWDGVAYVINHGSYPHSIKDIQANPALVADIIAIEGQNALTPQ